MHSFDYELDMAQSQAQSHSAVPFPRSGTAHPAHGQMREVNFFGLLLYRKQS